MGSVEIAVRRITGYRALVNPGRAMQHWSKTMRLDEIVYEIEARIEHLSALRQPGPVDLGPEDNYMDQDTLFAELSTLEAMLAVAASGLR
jgi:xanthine dehydrogenase iron-sulfur cluster and FAD-binding subunit A